MELQELVNRVGQHNAERWELEKILAPYISQVLMNVGCDYDHQTWKYMGVDNGKVRLWHYCQDQDDSFTIYLSLEELMGVNVE